MGEKVSSFHSVRIWCQTHNWFDCKSRVFYSWFGLVHSHGFMMSPLFSQLIRLHWFTFTHFRINPYTIHSILVYRIGDKTSWWRLFLSIDFSELTLFSLAEPPNQSAMNYHFVCFIVLQSEMAYALQSRWAICVCLLGLLGFVCFHVDFFLFFSVIILWYSLKSPFNHERIERENPNVFSFVIIYAMWFATFGIVVFTHFILYVFILHVICLHMNFSTVEREGKTKKRKRHYCYCYISVTKTWERSLFFCQYHQKQSENSWRAKCTNAMDGGGQRKGWKWQRK